MPTYNAEQILKILEQADKAEQTVTAVCREHGIAEATFYRWRKAYSGLSVAELQRLKELEKENARLKRLLAERVLEIDLLKELLGKKRNHRREATGGALSGRRRLISATGVFAGFTSAGDLSLSSPSRR
ncbi:MAG: transposase [Chloroflexi bacterium SZAS-1]|nr:transposase [Chloroflexi bacterium SZAS-1]